LSEYLSLKSSLIWKIVIGPDFPPYASSDHKPCGQIGNVSKFFHKLVILLSILAKLLVIGHHQQAHYIFQQSCIQPSWVLQIIID